MNDGWFVNDAIYVILYTHKEAPQCCLSFGRDIPTPDETTAYFARRAELKRINDTYKTIGNLNTHTHTKTALWMMCTRFTDAYREAVANEVLASLRT